MPFLFLIFRRRRDCHGVSCIIISGNKEALFVEVTRKYFMNWFYIDLREIADFDVEAMTARMESMYRDIFIKSWLEFEQADGISIRNYDFLFYRVMQENEEFEREYMRARETELEAWKIVLRNARRAGKLRRALTRIRRHAILFICWTEYG